MKTRKRTDEHSLFHHFFILEFVDGREVDLTKPFWAVVLVLVLAVLL